MTVRAIAAIGDPVLREPAREVTLEELQSPGTQQLIDDLIETMRHANGAGIAANQISVPVQIATIEVTKNARYPYKPPIPLTVIVNPRLTVIGDETVEINEGCLSVPLRGDLLRHVEVQVEYLDRFGAPHNEVKKGLTAGTFQHEVDHLAGMMIVDRIDPKTLATWDEFNQHQREAFVTRIDAFVARIGS